MKPKIKAYGLALSQALRAFVNKIPVPSRLENLKASHWLVIGAVVLLLGILYMVYAKKGLMIPPAPQVVVQEMVTRDVPLDYEYPARTAGSREVEIHARASGILIERNYPEGKLVKQDDILFKIDPQPFQAKVAQAEAQLKGGQASLKQAQQDWERVSDLYAKKMASARDKDRAVAILEEAKAKVEAAEADLKVAQINLGYTTVKAPITGITSQEGYSEGSLVDPATRSLLTRIVQIDPLYVRFSISDADVFKNHALITQERLPVTLKLADGSAYPIKGYVNFSDSTIDPKTGTVHARAIIANPDGRLLPGQFVRVTVSGLSQPNAILLPKKAIMQGPDGPFVYLVTPENKAAIQPITLGQSAAEGQIIERGLKAQDKVIIEGMIKVRPNAPVRIAKPEDTKDKGTKP